MEFIPSKKSQQINDLTLHFIALEREEQINPQVSRRLEIIKIRAKINEIETKKQLRGWGRGSAVECLPSMCQALGLILNTTYKSIK